jgi:hypothetical protein
MATSNANDPLVERVVFCWLILWEYESVLALQAGKLTAPQSAFHHRRIDAAHRRYLSSLRALATVRKLGCRASGSTSARIITTIGATTRPIGPGRRPLRRAVPDLRPPVEAGDPRPAPPPLGLPDGGLGAPRAARTSTIIRRTVNRMRGRLMAGASMTSAYERRLAHRMR